MKQVKYLKTFSLFLLLSFISINTKVFSGDASNKEVTNLKVLAIGNSFSDDAVEHYLYGLADANSDTILIGNMYIGGCSLERHYNNSVKNAPAYSYRKIVNGNKTTTPEYRLIDAIKDEDWDYISVQQVSGQSGIYESFFPYLSHLVSYIKEHATNPDVEIVMHATWAYAQDSNHKSFPNYGNDQLKMYESIADATQRAAKEAGIEIIIPSGTAIQNGRTSSLGDTFCRDGYHLELNYGRYTASATWYEKLFNKSVVGNSYIPSNITPFQAKVAQNAAHLAVENPYKVTSLASMGEIIIPDIYTTENEIYKDGWIDFNKNGKMDIYEDPNADIEDRIADLISQMTLEEKTNQMVTLYGYGRVLEDDLPTPEWKNRLWKDGIGAIDEHLNGFRQWGLPPSDNPYVWPASRHAWALNEVQRFFIEDTRLGIPVDFTNEGIRGVESYMATNFPTQLGLGHTWNRDLVEKVGEITGREGRLLGYTNVYAPILDVGRDQRWGRYEEVYGESPFLVAELGIAMVNGMQKDYQVASTGKHYAAYSNNKGGREGMSRVDPQMSPREVENVHMYPWERVIREAGMLGVMSSYNDYDGFPIQSSYYWLTTRLRDQMGFKGYIVSDSDAVEYLYSKHGTAADMKESVYQSVMAGLNVRCTFRSPDSYVLPLRDLVREGSIDMNIIDERVADVLRVKFLVGLFDQPYQVDLKQADIEVNSEENQQVSLQASRESLVLLKNENNVLPLKKDEIKTIAVSGPNANDASYALTHYGPLAVDVVTVLEGIQNKVGNDIEVLYSKGADIVDANWPDSEIIDYPITDIEQADIDKAVADALKSDVAIVVLGGNVRTAGENKSRSSIDLPPRQLDLLKAVYETGKPVILVMINGRPLAINWADRFVPGIIEAWYPGSQGGIAVADVLFGDYNPGGKLTVTFPKTAGQIPFNFPAKPASQVDGPRRPGLDGNQTRINGPLYSFGYGLSYTEFEYSDLKLSAEDISDSESVEVSFKVKNIGDVAGDEVVQLYTRDVLSSITTYEKNLRGFDRIHLLPGEEKEVKFTIFPQDLMLLNIENEWVVEPGEFRVMIGASSEDIRLSDSFYVLGEGFDKSEVVDTPPVISNPQTTTALYVLDDNNETYWEGQKGYHLTFPLDENKSLEDIDISWGENTDLKSVFEVQVSSGGGQFITVLKSTPQDINSVNKYTFEESAGTDLRIRIVSGVVNISEVDIVQ